MLRFSDRIYYELTYACNLKCIHCCNDISDVYNQLSLDQIKNFHIKAMKSGIKDAVLTGGEPTMNSQFMDIISFLSECGSVVVTTNGTTHSPDYFIDLLGQKKNVFLQISLDGFTSTSHDAIRGKGKFATTMNLVHKLIEANLSTQVGLSVVIMKNNISEIMDIVDFAVNSNLGSIHFPKLMSNGRGRMNWCAISPTIEEQIEIENMLLKKINESDRDIISVNRFNHIIASLHSQTNDEKGLYCEFTLKVAPDGNIYPCPLSYGGENCIGNINSTPDIEELSDNIQNKIKENNIKLQYIKENCLSCTVNSLCKKNYCEMCQFNRMELDNIDNDMKFQCEIYAYHYNQIMKEGISQ